MKKVMKKGRLLAGIVMLATVSLGEKHVVAKTYLETDQNYYTGTTVTRGFLDQEISVAVLGQDNWDKFQIAVTKGLVNYTPGMTFNDYYVANNLSPEDNFTVYPRLSKHLVALPDGKPGYWNANPNPKGVTYTDGSLVDYLTYVGPTTDRGAYWGDKVLEDPVLFSRLTVGTPTFGVFPSNRWQFPTQIGYGEVATVNDYMLTAENDIVIPTRFNTKREDVYLTMRSRAYFGAGLRGAQAYLSATSNGDAVVGSTSNPNFYIDTTSAVFMTPQAYDQLGTWSKLLAPSAYTAASRQMQQVGVDGFATKMNEGLTSIQAASGVNTIVSGNGGQIQLKGFYRQSAIDTQYTATDSERENDSLNTVDVTYYMYTTGDSEVTITTPLASNGQHLYSPNESVFRLETTRPYFSNFGDTTSSIAENDAVANFDRLLGGNSFSLTDNGVQPNGEAVGVDLARVRIRISTDNGLTYLAAAYTVDELKMALENHSLPAGQLTLYYTYAATDAQDSILGQLPSEIGNNTGAYAVPFTRKLDTTKRYRLTYQFTSEDGSTPLPSDVTDLLPIDTTFYATKNVVSMVQPSKTSVTVANGTWEFVGYPQNAVTVANSDLTVIGTWRFVETKKGSVAIKFVTTSGQEIKTEVVLSNVAEGTDYDVTRPPGDVFTWNGKTYRYVGLQAGSPAVTGQVVEGVTTVVFEYWEDTPAVPPIATGSIIVIFVDESGQEIKREVPASFANININSPYDVSALATNEIVVNGISYTKIGVTTGGLIGIVSPGDNTVVVSYKKKAVTTPPSTIQEPSDTPEIDDTQDTILPSEQFTKKKIVVRPNGQLPQTGEDTQLAIVGVGMIILTTCLAVVIMSKKNRNETR